MSIFARYVGGQQGFVAGGTGNVIGPGSSTLDAIAIFGNTGGNLLLDSAILISGGKDILFPTHGDVGAQTGQLSGTDYRPRNIFSANALIVGDVLGNAPPYGLNSGSGLFQGLIATGNTACSNTAVFLNTGTTFNSVAQSLIGFGKDGAFANIPAFVNSNGSSDFDVYFSLLHLNSGQQDLIKFGIDGNLSLLTPGSAVYAENLFTADNVNLAAGIAIKPGLSTNNPGASLTLSAGDSTEDSGGVLTFKGGLTTNGFGGGNIEFYTGDTSYTQCGVFGTSGVFRVFFDSIADGKVIATQGLGVGNSATATIAVGALARKMEVFNAAGASIGFVPIYASIT